MLLACFCYPIDPDTIPPPQTWSSGWQGAGGVMVTGSPSADVDPVLAELRSFREEARVKLQANHDAIVSLSAAVMGKNQLVDEDHVMLRHPTTGLVVRLKDAESSLERHSRLLWTLAEKGIWLLGSGLLAILGVVLTPWTRLWSIRKNGNGKRNEKGVG